MKNKIDVLYLSYDGMTDPLGQSQVLPYIIKLSKHNYNFTLISFEKKERFYNNKTIIEEICNENGIDWHPFFYTKNPPVISTLWDIFKMYKSSKTLYKKKHFKLIHCRSYITSLIGLRFKKKYNLKFIFDMRGFWADERVDGNLWSLKNPVYKLVFSYFKKKEKLFLEQADSVISLTQKGKEEMLNWNIKNLQHDKITVIPCAADYNLFELVTSEKKANAKHNLGLTSNEFVLSYIGSLGTWYLLDEMLLFFSLLKKQNPSAKFLFLTPDSKDVIIETAKKYGLTKKDFIVQFVQRNDIPKIAHASDYSIFFIKPTYSKKSSSPTKMAEIMAMGIPIICNKNVGDVEIIMKDSKAGFCIDELNNQSFIDTISGINNNFFNPKEIRENSQKRYDLQNLCNSYLLIYEKLINQ